MSSRQRINNGSGELDHHPDPGVDASTTSLGPILVDNDQPVKLSKRRWLVLFALSIFGLSIAVTGDTSPILHLILKLLGLRIDKYLYITQIFYYTMAAVAIPTACLVDKYGIKFGVYTCAGLYVLHGFFRFLLYFPDLPGWSDFKIYYWVVSSFLSTIQLSIFFLLPLKVSETWFSESERSVAWTIMFSQLNVGTCFASFLYPRIMQEVMDIKILAYINIVCVSLSALITFTCINRSEPEHPPNKRVAEAAKDTTPFLVSFMKMIKHKDIMVHLIHMSIFESVTLSMGSATQDIFTSVGFTEVFAGNFMAINAFVGLVMQIIMARFIHKVENITLTCKLSSALQVGVLVMYLVTLMLPGISGWGIIAVSVLLQMCKSWVAPNFTNMTAHLACGTVSQATIIGSSMTVTVATMTVIQTSFVSLIKITDKTTNYDNSLLFLAILAVVNEAIYLTIFKGQSKSKVIENESDPQRVQEQ